MLRIVRIAPAILLVLGSPIAAAQEIGDTARVVERTRFDIGAYLQDAKARAKQLERRIDVLGQLVDAADTVSPMAMSQSLTRASQKVEKARQAAEEEPALSDPVPTVIDIVSHLVTTPPFGMPADQLRARLFVEISKLEEDVLRRCDSFYREASDVELLDRTLEQIGGVLHSTAVNGGRASLQTRREALK
jgi:hypothetical protein